MNNIMDIFILITNLMIIYLFIDKWFGGSRKAKRELNSLITQYKPEAIFSATVLSNGRAKLYVLLSKEHILFISRSDSYDQAKISMQKFKWHHLKMLSKQTPFYFDPFVKMIFALYLGTDDKDYTLSKSTSICCLSSSKYDRKFNKYAKKYNDFILWIQDNIPARPEYDLSNLRK